MILAERVTWPVAEGEVAVLALDVQLRGGRDEDCGDTAEIAASIRRTTTRTLHARKCEASKDALRDLARGDERAQLQRRRGKRRAREDFPPERDLLSSGHGVPLLAVIRSTFLKRPTAANRSTIPTANTPISPSRQIPHRLAPRRRGGWAGLQGEQLSSCDRVSKAFGRRSWAPATTRPLPARGPLRRRSITPTWPAADFAALPDG